MTNKTITAICTGLSPSGIGIIRISGDESFVIASKIFKKGNGNIISEFESHKIYYGFIYDADNLIDEVILLAMKGPKSFTCEDVIEIQCHGGILMMQTILNLIIKNGAFPAEPGEFTKRAFLNGRIDLSEAEAVMDVISSQSAYALNNSVKHLNGKLFEKISNIRGSILNETAFIEAALDDPEHYSLDDYPEKLSDIVSNLIIELKKLSDSFNDGHIISEGIKTVILGKPNVGKSSFLNLLCGTEKAIVTDVAGTTRDILEDKILIDGILLNVIDTAGIHESDEIVEQIGIKKALDIANSADLIVMLIDGSIDLSDQDIQIFDFINKNNKKSIVLINKSDLKQVISIDDVKKYLNTEVINFSTFNETGLDYFKNFIKEKFIKGIVKYNDEIYISNVRHKSALDNSISSLNNVLNSINCQMPEDFYTIDLTDAYDYLGFIIGEETSEDVINEIFKKFCMGK